jgi:two-component system, OmpR family, phosphate regulon sensor histidine kinase PhoR
MTGWIVALIVVAGLGGAAVAWARARVVTQRADAAAGERDAARGVAETAEERRRATFAALPLAALRVDSANRLLEANVRALEWFPHLVAGQPIIEEFGEHEFADQVSEALVDGQPRRFEVRLFADGRRTYRVAVDVLEGPEALVFLTDLTEAIAYQDLRSQFVANVSHELRTPLTGLRGLLEALDDPDMDRAIHDRFVTQATAETVRLEALITDILFLSELEATQGMPSDARSDLRYAVAMATELVAADAATYRVAVRVADGDAAWTPLSERMSLTVARNLLENAVKYAGQGASVDVTIEHAPDGWVRLVVADDGAGIPERHLPHVFERFYRADASRSKRLGGTGLGLSIVKHIAERFAGNAEAQSREGIGTTITVVLPEAIGPGDDPLDEPTATSGDVEGR